MSNDTRKTAHPLTFGLSLIAGLGLVLMITALALGVTQGEMADGGLIGGLFAVGLVLLVSGLVAWALVVRPFAYFDDINVPMYTGHHDHGSSESHGAIVVADPHDVEPHAHS